MASEAYLQGFGSPPTRTACVAGRLLLASDCQVGHRRFCCSRIGASVLLLVNCIMADNAGESSPHGGSGPDRSSKIDQLVGRRIRLRRLLLQIDLAHLANDLGLSAEALASFEAGKQRPLPTMLDRIASHLGVSVVWFFRNFSVGALDPPVSSDPAHSTVASVPAIGESDIAVEVLALLDEFIQLTDAADRRAIVIFTRDRVAEQGK